jgi:hypothetical protein
LGFEPTAIASISESQLAVGLSSGTIIILEINPSVCEGESWLKFLAYLNPHKILLIN